MLRKLQSLQLVQEPLFVFTLSTADEFSDFDFDLFTFLIEILEILLDPRAHPLKEHFLGLLSVRNLVCELGIIQLRLMSQL